MATVSRTPAPWTQLRDAQQRRLGGCVPGALPAGRQLSFSGVHRIHSELFDIVLYEGDGASWQLQSRLGSRLLRTNLRHKLA